MSLAVVAGCGGAGGILAGGIAASGNWSGSFVSRSATGTVEIPFKLVRPEGSGPFPAVVMLHDCSGLGRRSSGSPVRWARKLAAQGYAVLLPDSFAPRGFPDGVCTNSQAQAASPYVRADDARAALDYLRTLPDIDSAHVGLMGGSDGGSTTLAAMVDKGDDRGTGFAAAIALYPDCGVSYGQWRATRHKGPGGSMVTFDGVYKPAAPLLILIGETDDWTPAPYCQSLAGAADRAGYPVSIKVYPGARHSFDGNLGMNYDPERSNANSPGERGATTGGDPNAWADAEREVTAFFAKYLKSADEGSRGSGSN